MLSLRYPEISHRIKSFDYGLLAIFLPEEKTFVLIIKTGKEAIQTAKVNKGFKVYLIKNPTDTSSHLGFYTAFFDNPDNPLAIPTPISCNPGNSETLIKLFSQPTFEVSFFDENDYEWLSAEAENIYYERFSQELKNAAFPDSAPSSIIDVMREFEEQFSLLTQKDDDEAYEIGLNITYDDFTIIDMREALSESNNDIFAASLERDKDVGAMQEKEIAKLLNRCFDNKEIYLNPYRADTKKELTDLLVVTDKVALFIQAKDSPNTEDMLNRTLERKGKTILHHIEKATKQMRGALTYAQANENITILSNNKEVIIDIKSKMIMGLIVVKELFPDSHKAGSKPVLDLIEELKLPIILLDYPQLHTITANRNEPSKFFSTLLFSHEKALEHNEFPILVFTKKHPE